MIPLGQAPTYSDHMMDAPQKRQLPNKARLTPVQQRRLDFANEQLSMAKLPTYSELREALMRLMDYGDKYLHSHRLHGDAPVKAAALLNKIPLDTTEGEAK